MTRYEEGCPHESPIFEDPAADYARLADGIAYLREDLGVLSERMRPKLVLLQANLEELQAQTEALSDSVRRLQDVLERQR